MNSEDGQVYSVCILQFSCFTKYNRMQTKHKQTKCEHSRRNSYRLQLFSRYHYSKSKNYLKRRHRIRHWIPMFIGTPCRLLYNIYFIFRRRYLVISKKNLFWKHTHSQTRSFERQICAQTQDLQIFKKFNMSQINPEEIFHITAYSVQLPYIAGHSL